MIRRVARARLIRGGTGSELDASDGLVDIDIDAAGRVTAVTPTGAAGSPTASGPLPTASGPLPTTLGPLSDDPHTLDAEGCFVTSGLWDEHVHLGQWAQQASRLDFGALASADAVLARVREAVASALQADATQAGATRADATQANSVPPGAAEVIAMRVRGAEWGDELTRGRLDRASQLGAGDAGAAGGPGGASNAGSASVVLISNDLHGAWLNSAALARYGFDPQGPSHIVEDECFALVRELDRVSDDELDRRVTAAARAAAARGVVGVVDFEMRWGVDDWLRRERAGFDALRVETAIYPQFLDRAIEAGLRTGNPLGERGLLRVGPLKVITDGSLGTQTAWCCEPYPGGGDGRSLISAAELEALLRRAHEAGIRAAVHAIGDRAGAAVLDAFERVGCGGRLEHAQLLRGEDVPRFAALGVEASVQPEHLLDDREAIAALWPGRAGRAFPFASLVRHGATLRFGSDAPVAPLDPWRAIAAAVYRSRPGERPLVPSERVTVAQALRASMRGGLRPQVGRQADLILVEKNPLQLSDDAGHEGDTNAALAATRVHATLVAGRLTHLA